MGDRVTVRLESGQKDAFEEMTRNGDADNDSEALRRSVNVGLAELGYLNGCQVKDTNLRVTARRFRDAFALLGVFMVGLTFWLPLELRAFAAAPFAASLGCWGLDRALEGRTFEVTHQIGRLFGGDRA